VSATLKTNTVHRYRDYLRNDLIPAFGTLPRERLTHDLPSTMRQDFAMLSWKFGEGFGVADRAGSCGR
jgi:hypothetical protein